MQLGRRKFLQYAAALIAYFALPKITSAEHFYVRCPIILGHDMNVEREKSRFTSAITRAIANGYTPISLDDLLYPLVVGLPLGIEKPFLVTLDDGYRSQLGILDFLAKNNVRAQPFI